MKSLAGMQVTGQAACLENKVKGGGSRPVQDNQRLPKTRWARRRALRGAFLIAKSRRDLRCRPPFESSQRRAQHGARPNGRAAVLLQQRRAGAPVVLVVG